jgi:hypothetical protein
LSANFFGGILGGLIEPDVRASADAGAMFDGLEESPATWLFPVPFIRHESRARL